MGGLQGFPSALKTCFIPTKSKLPKNVKFSIFYFSFVGRKSILLGLCFRLLVTLKVREDSLLPVLFCCLRRMIPRTISGCQYLGIEPCPLVILWYHWYPLFRTSNDSAHKFQSKVGFIVACALLSLVCNVPQSHLWLQGPGNQTQISLL